MLYKYFKKFLIINSYLLIYKVINMFKLLIGGILVVAIIGFKETIMLFGLVIVAMVLGACGGSSK